MPSVKPFTILEHLSKLTPDEGSCGKHEGSYFCPVCEAKNFKVDLKTGKYNAFGCSCTDTPSGRRAVREAVAPINWEKPHRIKQKRTWEYCDSAGNPLIKVHRQDNGDGTRRIWQTPLQEGSVRDLKRQVLPYRYAECLKALEQGEIVFWVEGEPCADALWGIGIPATTTLGGTNNYRAEQYSELFPAESLVICPDRDQVGLKYSSAIAADYPAALWCYAYPDSFLWARLPGSNGADIADWIKEGATAEVILASVGSKRHIEQTVTQRDAEPALAKPNAFKQAFHKIEKLYEKRLRFNEFTKEIELDGEAIELATIKVVLAVEENLDLNLDRLELILQHLAKQNTFHPVKDDLLKCYKEHSDTEILQQLAERYFGSRHLIYNTFLKRTLIAAVARAFEPGCKVDTALILQGKQGFKKSTFFKTLAGADYFDDSLGTISDKDEKLKLHQTWFAEWAELESVFKRKDMAATKAFLSSSVDVVRPPYGKQAIRMKRQSIIVGTTNQDQFLSDSTGNRRFWIVPVAHTIDVEQLKKERDRIWGAAVALYKAGEQWWLTDEEEKLAQNLARDYQTSDPWQSKIEAFLIEWRLREVTTSEVLTNCLEIELGRQTRGDEMRAADCLKRLGWQSTRKAYLGKRRRVWASPDQPEPSINVEVDTLQSLEGEGVFADSGQPGQLDQSLPGATTHSNGVESPAADYTPVPRINQGALVEKHLE